MYADDSTMYSAAVSNLELSDVMSIELTKVADWVNKNKLVLNISKTKCMIFSSRHKLLNDPTLCHLKENKFNK